MLTQRQFKFVAVGQTAIVLVGSLVWFYLRTKFYLAGPPDGDRYAQNGNFQWMIYLGFYLPSILLINGIFIGVMRGLVSPTHPNPNNSFKGTLPNGSVPLTLV